jgi:hypothetical protein
MSPCALTMPVLGESSAATAGTWGSRARASSRPSICMSTPLARPRARSSSSTGRSSSSMATISLPMRRWGTWWRRQKS